MTADVATSARSLLFLSVDLVGSTEFKQRRDDWQEDFLGFYRQFPQIVGDESRGTGLDFELWKPIGDELIFTVAVDCDVQVLRAVRIWLAAMDEYQHTLDKRPDGMQTKGGAFIATFPGPDTEVSLPRRVDDEQSDKSSPILNAEALAGPRRHERFLYDYLGPSIDTGFRVVGQSDARHFALSVEVAWAVMLAHTADRSTRRLDDLVFRGPTELRGVWGGRHYPVFALDRQHDDPVHRGLLALAGGPPDIEAAISLCADCVASPGWMSAIYLPRSDHGALRRDPPSDVLALGRQDNEMGGSETLPDESAP